MLRLSELYTSIQGEGYNVGQPTQFVRFAGCNYRCPGWPCDTPYAIEPSIWRKEAEKLTAYELAEKLEAWPRHLCLTGGEPLMQPNLELQEFYNWVWERSYSVECFTNGSKPIPRWAHGRIQFMMDWKLPGSGEYGKDMDIREENAKLLLPNSGIKFVVKDEKDLHTAQLDYEYLVKDCDVIAQFWITPVWDTKELDAQYIVEFVRQHKLPWRVSLQLHKYVWEPDQRGI